MNFLDMIKNSVLERFDGTLSVWQVVLGLLFAKMIYDYFF